jgi:hypothetical protein
MAISTVKITDTIEFCKRLSFNRSPVIGNSLEPAITAANIVMQTILGPPFTWFWNTTEIGFTTSPTPQTSAITNVTISAGELTVVGNNSFSFGSPIFLSGITTVTQLNGLLVIPDTVTPTGFTAPVTLADVSSTPVTGTATNTTTQDYTLPVPEFSHIEHASVLDINQTPAPGRWTELTVKENLSLETKADRPRWLNPHMEDGAGNMTFRVLPPPDKAYPVSIHIQNSAPRITSVNQTWAPLPDYMQYIYTWGFLTLIWSFSDDARAPVANQKFIAGLLGRAEGLSEEDRNVFLNNWNSLTGLEQMKTQQGVQARAT